MVGKGNAILNYCPVYDPRICLCAAVLLGDVLRYFTTAEIIIILKQAILLRFFPRYLGMSDNLNYFLLHRA
jgi:hypothetical protein